MLNNRIWIKFDGCFFIEGAGVSTKQLSTKVGCQLYTSFLVGTMLIFLLAQEEFLLVLKGYLHHWPSIVILKN
jgi:hypothetical protein